MISEFVLNLAFGILSEMLSVLPEISWNVETMPIEYICDVISVVYYLLPVDTIHRIIVIYIALNIFRILISIPKAIWDLLPIV